MKKSCFLLFAILSMNCYAQVIFEKGYFINNSDQKTDCLIKNVDWRNNPTNFEYKLSEDTEPAFATIETVKEFGIYTISKYIRNTVNIDRSSENPTNLSELRNPIFKEEQLFLKVLNEGKANLYLYNDTGLKRFFYNIENDSIKQLVYKKYERFDGKLGVNNYYKQQMFKDLVCSSIGLEKIEKLDYKQSDLMNFFKTYNECNNVENTNYVKKQKKDLFNLSLRPRLNYSSLTYKNTFSPELSTKFDSKLGFGFGIEAEMILPFNKNKWSIAIEPTYQSFKSSKTTSNVTNISGGTLTAEIDYVSVELPVSFRHYLFLNNDSKIFFNVSYVLDLMLKISTELKRADDSIIVTYDERASQSNFAVGFGYKFDDKYGFELRYQTNREVIDGNRNGQSSEYNTVSIIFGYTLF